MTRKRRLHSVELRSQLLSFLASFPDGMSCRTLAAKMLGNAKYGGSMIKVLRLMKQEGLVDQCPATGMWMLTGRR
jgi:hypothetical protein